MAGKIAINASAIAPGSVTRVRISSIYSEVSRPGFVTQSLLIDVRDQPSVGGAVINQTVSMVLGSVSSSVDVVATTPLAGGSLTPREIAAPVQTLNKQDVESSGALDLSDLLNRRLSGVNINENQANPFQPDVNYRGYTASPLLGTPQGISIYMDGVRLNQPFGDVVSWDLIPRVAISEMTLMPGSNPVFGLNTLGARSRSRPKTAAATRGPRCRSATEAMTVKRSSLNTAGPMPRDSTGTWRATD